MSDSLYFAALIELRANKYYRAGLLSCLALAVALTTLSIKEVPQDEGGKMTTVVGYGLGFYLRLSSMLVVLAAATKSILKPDKSNQTIQP